MNLYNTLVMECKGRVRKDEFLSAHTSFHIGGPADCFLQAEGVGDVEVAMAAAAAAGCPILIIGNGTNLLVADEGFRGLVLRLGSQFMTVAREGTCVRSGAGLDLARLLEYCAGHGLGGLEFATGIPGTVGGAVSTKANTRTGSICQRLYQVLVLGPDRKIKTMDAATYDRRSAADHGPGCIIEASFQLAEAPPADIRREMERYLERRRTTQPLDWPSAGCIFRNPAEQPAGRLIDQCGCKGMRIGGALVSELHANYIINTGGARSQDVLELIERVRERVYSQTGVTLELEVNVVTAMG